MKIINTKLAVIVSAVTVVSILFGTVMATALVGENGLFSATAGTNNSTTKYEKPSIGDISLDGAYPDEIESNSSANAEEKEWYEYITYSKKPLETYQEGNTRYVFYDPYDYSYGMIMEFSSPESKFGEYYDPEGFTTANEISVSYSVSKSHSWASDVSADLTFEKSAGAELGSDYAKISAETKFALNIGVSHTQSGSDDSSASKDITYNALYFNSNGTPYRWRVVKYTVYLPLYCEKQVLKDGQWITDASAYCLLATVQGTCREWINNVAYIEDWRTGEPVAVENFWKEFFSKESLMKAYKENMLPTN